MPPQNCFREKVPPQNLRFGRARSYAAYRHAIACDTCLPTQTYWLTALKMKRQSNSILSYFATRKADSETTDKDGHDPFAENSDSEVARLLNNS